VINSERARSPAEVMRDGVEKTTNKVDETKGQVRETIAGVTDAVNRQAGEIQKDVAAAMDQTAGKVGAVKGQVRETITGVTDAVNRQAGDIQKDVTEVAGNVNATIAGLDRTTLALVSAAAAILVAVGASLIRGRLVADNMSPLERRGQTMLNLGKEQASKATFAAEQTARATARQLETKLADQLDEMADQLRAQSPMRRVNGLPGGVATPLVVAAGIVAAVVAVVASGRHTP
jgi:hypothetical protein